MSTAKQRAAAKAAQMAAAANATAEPDQEAAETATANLAPRQHRNNVQVRPVRKSIDLPPRVAHDLAAWESETALMLGRSRVTSADVCRALVRRLLTDETLARQVRDDLAADTD